MIVKKVVEVETEVEVDVSLKDFNNVIRQEKDINAFSFYVYEICLIIESIPKKKILKMSSDKRILIAKNLLKLSKRFYLKSDAKKVMRL